MVLVASQRFLTVPGGRGSARADGVGGGRGCAREDVACGCGFRTSWPQAEVTRKTGGRVPRWRGSDAGLHSLAPDAWAPARLGLNWA